MEKVKKYLAPEIIYMECKVERGFEISNFKEKSPNDELNPPDGNGEVMGHNDWGALFT